MYKNFQKISSLAFSRTQPKSTPIRIEKIVKINLISTQRSLIPLTLLLCTLIKLIKSLESSATVLILKILNIEIT